LFRFRSFFKDPKVFNYTLKPLILILTKLGTSIDIYQSLLIFKIFVMKTLNNQSILKSVSSLIVVVLLMGLSASTQAMDYLPPFEEQEVIIEDWMTDLESFNSDEAVMEVEEWMVTLESFVTEDIDQLHLENWMVDIESYANDNNDQLIIEDWMANIESFNTSDEYPLSVELWMTCMDEFHNDLDTYLMAESFEQPLQIENWMTDLTAFNKLDAFEIEGLTDIELNTELPTLLALKN